ncbi:isochorismatase hydrolase [Tricladium varicosporioides]|nr:isochorismatase hydrolase [Hymenoscyphus varicosporioides]
MAQPQSGKSFRSFLGIPPSSPTVNDSVLIIIDAQNDYDYGLLAIADLELSRPNILTLLNKYRAAEGDIVHVVHDTPPGAPLFTQGTPAAEIFPELTPLVGEKVVHKTQPSSFTDTVLHEHLQNLGKKKIVLVGYMAHNCVSSTSRIGAEMGYDVLVVRDAIGDRDVPGATAKQLVDVVLAELGDVSATIVNTADF